MSMYVKQSATWSKLSKVYRKVAGVWTNITQVYRKEAGTWKLVFQDSVGFVLNNSTNVNLATWLVGQGAEAGTNVVVTIPTGQVVGGTVAGAYALDIGDISAFDSVTVDNQGEIQGKGGTSSSKAGSHAIKSLLPFTLINSGAIRGGGGAGGNGGQGGTGSYTTWTGYRYSRSPEDNWRSPTKAHDDELMIYWDNALIYQAQGNSGVTSKTVGSYTYERGTLQSSGPSDGGWNDERYTIRRSSTSYQSGGAGGTGGNGQGYGQALSVGSNGASGSNNSGDGGDGGTGAAWALSGATGNNGANGNYGSGYSGGSGGSGGRAIDASGVEITISDTGTTDGDVDYIGIPL